MIGELALSGYPIWLIKCIYILLRWSESLTALNYMVLSKGYAPLRQAGGEDTLTDAAKAILAKAPQVAQGLLVAGLEVLPIKKLRIYLPPGELVRILGAQELPPRLILSSEINLSKRNAIKKTPDEPPRKPWNERASVW